MRVPRLEQMEVVPLEMSLDLFTVDLAQGIRSLMVSSVPRDDEWASEGELHLETKSS